MAYRPASIDSAEALAHALGGATFAGGEWRALCPAHDDHSPSLAITETPEGRILFNCQSRGCSQQEIIAALRARGLWPFWKATHSKTAIRCESSAGQSAEAAVRRTAAALKIWRTSSDAAGTLVETYLKSRGITGALPGALRFNRSLWHSPSHLRWPGMVALVTRGTDDAPIGIHRTFLARDGGGKAPIDANKMMLGFTRGGAARLGGAGDVLHVGEGIETCLSVLQETGKLTWAALSTGGLRALELPDHIHEVVILADGDDPGEAAAQHAARRWMSKGRGVRIARPPRGRDFNDLVDGASEVGGPCGGR